MPNLAIIAKDSTSLSPARASLAALLAQAEHLRLDTGPLAERLRRCDETSSRVDRALAGHWRLSWASRGVWCRRSLSSERQTIPARHWCATLSRFGIKPLANSARAFA
jgi:hypothetical protein